MTRIQIVYAPKRPKPKAGDRKTIRGIEHVRQQVRVKHGPYAGALVVNNGRPVFEWVPVTESSGAAR